MMLPRVNLIKCIDADYLLFATDDIISNVLHRTGQWEEYLIAISKMFLKGISEPLVLDIGANLGAYSIPIAKEIQNIGGKVIGFEPQRIVYYQLCGNIILNRLCNYQAINKAVGHFIGEVEIPELNYENCTNIGAFSMNKEYRDSLDIEKYITKNSSLVPVITLDSLNIHKSPDLIKIDVEGFELNVLKGGENFLEKHNFPPIIFEAWDLDWYSEEKTRLLKFIKYLGYEISLSIRQEYVAQHPKNKIKLELSVSDSDVISIKRVR